MGRLENETDQRCVLLQHDHLIGRSPRCTLRIDDERVSKVHASIRWTGDGWLLKDLGSLNSTTLDGRTLRANEHVVLKPGARIGFGHGSLTWLLTDDGPPVVMALPEDGGQEIAAIDGLLVLPSPEQPVLTVHRDHQGGWVADLEGARSPVADQQHVSVCGRRYQLCLPEDLIGTSPLQPFSGHAVADLSITFRTSHDLENIELDVRSEEQVRRFAARTHNELLLVLARARQADQAQQLAPANCGWMYLDDLCRSVALSRERLYIDVYRIRRQFAELGVVDPANIIERRASSKQLRIGTGQLEELKG
jgi:predicted component of type VI protein secretion system